MKTKNLLSICLFLIATAAYSTSWTIVNTNFAFTPAAVTISQGDTVVFSLGEIHNAVEVSEATWNANGNTALAGGFETPFGGGLVIPANLLAGVHYYVCDPHASSGMKGIITVNSSNYIADYEQAVIFSVYPNPAGSMMSVKVDRTLPGGEYRITDVTGRIVATGFIRNEVTTIDMARVPPGDYFFGIAGLRSKAIKIIKY